MGVFGYGEIIHNLSHKPEDREVFTGKVTGLFPTATDIKNMVPAVLRGTAIGFPLGALPAGGAELPTLMSYAIEKRLSKHPEEFGRGAIEAVAGPEAANNASAAGTLVYKGTLVWKSTGATGNSPVVGSGGTVDFSQAPAAVTVGGTVELNAGAGWLDPAGVISTSYNLKLNRCNAADVNLDLGVNKTLAVS